MPWLTIILVLAIVGMVLAIKFLPWWASVILLALPIVFWKYIAAGVLTWFVRRTALDLASALAGATVEVYALKAIPAPPASVLEEWFAPEDEEDKEFEESIQDMPDEPPETRDWYELEVTIAPQPRTNEDGAEEQVDWQPDSLMFVAPGMSWGEIDDSCLVGRVEIETHGKFRTAAKWNAYGPARLRLLLGVKPGAKRLAMRYMFAQELGRELELPPPLPRTAT